MERKKLLILILSVFTWYSCSKTGVEPQSKNQSTSSLPVHFATNQPRAAITSYTPSGVVNLDGAHDITISGKSINGGTAPAITLSNCYNVHITQNSLGNSSNVGIYLYHCYNITIDYNYITNVSCGVYVDHSTSGGIAVNNNQFLNMIGPFPRGQFVQFNTVSGPNNQIGYNKCENITGQSSTQEAINLYMCNGSPSNPIQVIGNQIRGGGPDKYSGGIQLGDNGGSYEVASDNILVNPGAMGLSISGGDHISFLNNKVYAGQQSFTNVGVIVWGQLGFAITNPTISGNQIKFTSANYSENDSWISPGNPTPNGWNSNNWNANLDESILPATLVSPSAASVPLSPSGNSTPAVSGGGSNPVAVANSNGNSNAGGSQNAPIVMTGKSYITLSNLTINGGGSACIKLVNCNNMYITACMLQNSSNVAIELDNCSNITIEKNNIRNVAAGIVATNCGSGINVFTNQMQNMQGGSAGTFIRFVNVNGSNSNISFNKLQNMAGQSSPQHAIDIISSNGTSGSPITVDGNWIRGSASYSAGGGILLGNGGGSYQVAKNNILADPGQFGLAIIGGNGISVVNNTVYSQQQSFSNVGIYVWSQSSRVSNSTVSGNQVNFINSGGNGNHNWLASGESTPSGWYSNNWGANVDESVLPATIVSM